jgi:hypothetical protein
MKKRGIFLIILLLIGVTTPFVFSDNSKDSIIKPSYLAEGKTGKKVKKLVNCNDPKAQKLAGDEQYKKVCIDGASTPSQFELTLECDDEEIKDWLSENDYKEFCTETGSEGEGSSLGGSNVEVEIEHKEEIKEITSPSVECTDPNAKAKMGEIEYNRKCVTITEGCIDKTNVNICMGEADDGYIYEGGEKGVSNNIYACVTKKKASGETFEQAVFSNNPYCSVYCKEDSETYYQGYGYNPKTGFRIGSGQYFEYKPFSLGEETLNNLPHIRQYRTCIYKTDIGKLTTDLYGKAYNKDNIKSITTASITGGYYKEAYDAITTYYKSIEKVKKNSEKIFEILSETDCVTGKVSNKIVGQNNLNQVVDNNLSSDEINNMLAKNDKIKTIGVNSYTMDEFNINNSTYVASGKGTYHRIGIPKGGFHIGTYTGDKESEICCKYSKWEEAAESSMSEHIKGILIGIYYNKPHLMNIKQDQSYSVTVNFLDQNGNVLNSVSKVSAPATANTKIQVARFIGFEGIKRENISCSGVSDKDISLINGKELIINNVTSNVVCNVGTTEKVPANSFSVKYSYIKNSTATINGTINTTLNPKTSTQEVIFNHSQEAISKVECLPAGKFGNITVNNNVATVTDIKSALECSIYLIDGEPSGTYSANITINGHTPDPYFNGSSKDVNGRLIIEVPVDYNGVKIDNTPVRLDFGKMKCIGTYSERQFSAGKIIFYDVTGDINCNVKADFADKNKLYTLYVTVNFETANGTKKMYNAAIPSKANFFGVIKSQFHYNDHHIYDETGQRYFIDTSIQPKCTPNRNIKVGSVLFGGNYLETYYMDWDGDFFCTLTAKSSNSGSFNSNNSNTYLVMGDDEGKKTPSTPSQDSKKPSESKPAVDLIDPRIGEYVDKMSLSEMQDELKKEMGVENLDVLEEKIYTGKYWRYVKGKTHKVETRYCEDTKIAKEDNPYISNTNQYTNWTVSHKELLNKTNKTCLDETISVRYKFAESLTSSMNERTAYVYGYKNNVLCEKVTYTRSAAPCGGGGGGGGTDEPGENLGPDIELCLNKLEKVLLTLSKEIQAEIEKAETMKLEYFTKVRSIKKAIESYSVCHSFENLYTDTDMPQVEGFVYDEMSRTNPKFKEVVSKIKLIPKTELKPETSALEYCAHSAEGMDCNNNKVTKMKLPVFIEEIKTVLSDSTGTGYTTEHKTETMEITFYDNAVNRAKAEIGYGVGAEIYSVKPTGDVTTKNRPDYMAAVSDNALNYIGFGLPVSIMTRAGKYNYSFELIKLGKQNRLLPKFSSLNDGTVYECNYFVGNQIFCHTPKCEENIIYCLPNDEKCFEKTTPGLGEIKDTSYKIFARVIENANINPTGRDLGTNWDSKEGEAAIKKITNDGDSIYLGEPDFSITLTGEKIKEIRELNKTNNYAKFELKCNSDGNDCASKFLEKYVVPEKLAEIRSKWRVYDPEKDTFEIKPKTPTEKNPPTGDKTENE